MRPSLFLSLGAAALVAVLTVPARAHAQVVFTVQGGPGAGTASSVPERMAIGTVLKNFAVSEGDAGSPTVIIPTDSSAATVLLFVSSRCPVSMAYNARMNALYKDYASKNVRFAFVSSNFNELAPELQQLRTKAGFSFPIYRDLNNELADQFGARVTPEIFVFDKTGTLQYRGAIDDSHEEGSVQKRPLREALDAVLAGKGVDVSVTNATGCSIKRKKS